MNWTTYVVIVVCVSAAACHDHPVPSYFRNTDENGNLLHRQWVSYDAIIPKPFVMHILRKDADAVLKASPTVLDNGGVVNVTWLNIENPNEKDYIALYCPVDDNPAHYLDYIFVTVSKTWQLGYGETQVFLYNMRTNCVFKYFRSQEHSQLVSVSNELSFSNGGPLAPLQGHIALTGKVSEMRVMWTSDKGNDPPVVRYGLSASMNLSKHEVSIKTYTADEMCESPANSTGFWDPGYIYDALLENLKPNTKYYYSYGTEDHMSPVSYFQTSLPAGDPTSYKFIAYGDMGIAPYSAATTSKLIQKQLKQDQSLRFVLHNGDISYAEGYAYAWEQWMKLIEPYSTLLPYMVGIGNHEQDHVTGGIKHDPSGAEGDGGYRPKWGNNGHDSGGECGVPMYKRFHMPDNGNAIWWYSYDYGLVHYVMMSTEHDFTPGSRQYTWLENDLKSVNRSKTPWLIFAGHRAMYCSALLPDDYVVALNMQRLFEDMLYKYKVDLTLWSHYHSYERTCKVYQNECREDGITHIVVGSAGKSIDLNIWFKKSWSMFHHNEYGYGIVTVANTSALKWEWIQNSENKVMDYVWITK